MLLLNWIQVLANEIAEWAPRGSEVKLLNVYTQSNHEICNIRDAFRVNVVNIKSSLSSFFTFLLFASFDILLFRCSSFFRFYFGRCRLMNPRSSIGLFDTKIMINDGMRILFHIFLIKFSK